MSGSYQIIIKKKTHFNRNRVPIEKSLFFIQEYNHFLPFADNSRIIGIPHQEGFPSYTPCPQILSDRIFFKTNS